ncbi:MAG: DUF6259 domain-containing protein [Eubacteriales bacterium]
MNILHFGKTADDALIRIDAEHGVVTALRIAGRELLAAPSALFALRMRRQDGTYTDTSAPAGQLAGQNASADGSMLTLTYTQFPDDAAPLSATIALSVRDGALSAVMSVENPTDMLAEWVEPLPLVLLPLRGEGGALDGEILYPFNEGILVDSMKRREENAWMGSREERYPSEGSYPVFPNMLCSQMLAYLFDASDRTEENRRDSRALYFGAHDASRGVKAIDFHAPSAYNGGGSSDKGLEINFRIYCGVDYGKPYRMEFPLVVKALCGGWDAAAEEYRAWFEENLPPRARKISENPSLPDWYADSPLVVSYPVRGIHDMDKMDPNALYPYTNGLLLIDEIAEATGARLLVLLMHWEGTAPWAPPYVWPAYGDPDNFDRYLHALHDRGHMLGVYCSGFGYTIQSNLTEYTCKTAYEENHLEDAMCAGPDGRVAISHICTGQRSGYDICPASALGESILRDAYLPLLTSEVDYAQILDQNHGGSQYFCYSREHGHAPAPGPWMTGHMQKMLGTWNDAAQKTLLGCESAAAEPFIGNLQFSDNRFELCYIYGRPIPLYAYLYHEYVRNFMGNQVCCPLPHEIDTLRYRMGYSFSVGDCMTLVFEPQGRLMLNWGTRDFDNPPDKEKAYAFIANLTRFYREEAKPYLYNGRMIGAGDIRCGTMPYGHNLPAVHVTAWEADGKRVRIFVNSEEEDAVCYADGEEIIVPAMHALLKEFR